MESYNDKKIKELTIKSLLESFRREDDHEVVGDICTLGILPLEARETLWAFAHQLLGKARMRDGEAGQACRMIEVYFAKLYNTGIYDIRMEDTLLIFATTLRLVSKVQSNVNFLKGDFIVQALLQRGIVYFIEDINRVERVVFMKLNAHVSVWTNVQKVHVMALQLNFKNSDVPFAGAVMDWVEMQLPNLIEKLQIDAASSSETHRNANSLRTSHLIAAVLVAAHKLLKLEGNVTSFLASWSHCAPDYIEWLGNIIYSNVAENIHGKFKTYLRSCNIALIWVE